MIRSLQLHHGDLAEDHALHLPARHDAVDLAPQVVLDHLVVGGAELVGGPARQVLQAQVLDLPGALADLGGELLVVRRVPEADLDEERGGLLVRGLPRMLSMTSE